MERGELTDRLGRHLRAYPCANGRRLRHGIWSLVIVVVLVPIGVVTVILHDDFVSSVPNPPTYTPFVLVGCVAFGISVLLLPYGCRRLIQGLRSRGNGSTCTRTASSTTCRGATRRTPGATSPSSTRGACGR